MMTLARRIALPGLIVASVQGPNSFFVRDPDRSNPRIGFGWMMQYKAEETIQLHHGTLSSVIESIAGEFPVDRGAIFLMAFSQSVSLCYRFAFTNAGVVRGVIAVCGGIPGDWDENKYKPSNTDVLIVAGETDEFYPVERTRRFKEALERRASSVDYVSYPLGHVFPRESLPMIRDWIAARLASDE
jgi:predicted esterase